MQPKPLEIFVIAEQFYWAGQLAARVPREAANAVPENPYYAIGRGLPNMEAAAVACLAFALELYFKCLIRMGRKPYPRIHDLVELFGMIGIRHQATVKRYYRQNTADVRAYLEREYTARKRPMPKLDFDYVLSSSKNAFRIMRYIFEGLQPSAGWLADYILEGARQTILAKHPDWATMRAAWPGEVIVRSTFQVR
jgi:HEPN domain-containing protein